MPKGYLSDNQIMKRLKVGRFNLQEIARKHNWKKEPLGKYRFYREADVLAYERSLAYPTPEPKPEAKPQQAFGRRRGFGTRTLGM
jgi:hypothetical protein